MVVFILDYDGVIVDSYSNVKHIYETLKNKFNLPEGFVEVGLMLEDLIDFSEKEEYWYSIYEKYFREVFNMKNFSEVLSEYWKLREENQILFEDALDFLKKCGSKSIILTGTDTNIGEKLRRVQRTGVDKFVLDIFVHRWNSNSEDGFLPILRRLLKKYSGEKVYYVDDKVTRLALVSKLKKEFENLEIIKRDYKPNVYPYALSWKYPKIEVKIIKDLRELYEFCYD